MHLLIRWLALAVMRVFYRAVGTTGREHLPAKGPVLVVANHPNGLLDPMVARRSLAVEPAFLAKSTFFRTALGRAAMRAFHGIPVYRPRDGEDTSKNEATFEACRRLLTSGGWLMMFPEGTSHGDPQMRPLKTGAARIALQAEAASGFRMGLRVLPVGLLYENKVEFRSRVGVAIGPSFDLSGYAEQWAQDERAAALALTDEMNRRLTEVVLQADSNALWKGFVAVASWTAKDAGQDMAEIEARARRLALAYRRLRDERPDEAERLDSMARRFAAALRSVGIEDPFSLEKLQSPKLSGVVRFLLPMVLLAPAALVGVALGWVPYRIVGLFAKRLGNEEDIVSSIKAIGGMAIVVPWWLVQALVLGLVVSPAAGLGALVLAPVTGYAAVRFEERLKLRKELFRGLRLRLGRVEAWREIRARREELAGEIDRVLAG